MSIWTTHRQRVQGRGMTLPPVELLVALGIIIGLLFLPLSVDAQGAGDLDASFGDAGLVLTGFSLDSEDHGNDAIIQPDGKIVVVGSTNGDFALARYLPDGSPDPTFSFNGRQHTGFASGSHDVARAVALQHDGKIVVAGYSNANGSNDFALARYHTDGNLDTTFGSDGKVLLDFTTIWGNNGPDEATALAIQPDGKIVAGGIGGPVLGMFALARYDTNGALDTAFGSNGVVITDFTCVPVHDPLECDFDTIAGIWSLALQADGKIVAAGTAEMSGGIGAAAALARYLHDGDLDTTFGDNAGGNFPAGTVLTDLDGEDGGIMALTLQPDGKLVVTGSTGVGFCDDPYHLEFAMLRYHADGTLDLSFGNNGQVTTDLGSDASANALALQPDGKLVVAGTQLHCGVDDLPSRTEMILARYQSDGSLDTNFGSDGAGLVALQSNRDASASAVVIQPLDGRLVAAGSSYPVPGNHIDSDLIVARYHGGSPCEVVTTSGEVTGFAANGQEVNLPKDLHKAIDSVSTQPGHQLSLYTWFGSTKSFAEAQGSLDLDPDTQVKKVKCETLEAPEPPPDPVSPCEVINMDGEVTGFAADGQEVNLPKDLHRAIDLVSTQTGYQLSLYTWFGSTKSFTEAQGSLNLDPNTQVKKIKCETLIAPEPPPAPVSPCEVINTNGEIIGFTADGQEVNLPKDLHKTIDLVSTQTGYQLSLYTWFGSTKSFTEAQGSLDLDPNTQVKKVKCEAL